MKKIWISALTVLWLLGCQQRPETAKNVDQPEKTKKDTMLVVQEEIPVPSQSLGEVKPPGDDLKNASVNFRRGLELVKAGKYDEGIEYLNRALENEPGNSRVLFNRGYAYYSKKEYDMALADFSNCLKIDPKDTTAYLYSGLSRYYIKDWPEAMKNYSDAIKFSKRYATAYFNRGVLKGQMGDYKGSIQDLTQAIIIRPDYPHAYYNRGLAYFFNHDSNNACMDWIQANRMGAPDAQKAIDAYCEKYKDWIK